MNVGGGSHVTEDGEEYSTGGKWIEMVVEGDHVHIVCPLVPGFDSSDAWHHGFDSLNPTDSSFL